MWILRRKGGITAKRLGRIIGCRASYKYLPRGEDFIINYGTNYPHANLNAKVNFNKLEVYQKLQEAGIRQPRIFMKGEEIPE